jgi:RNAse (barnase) inhibitor barstar
MASFPHDESSRSRLDFRLLRDGGVVLYHSGVVLGDDLAWLRSEKYEVHDFDARRWKAEDDFHFDMARSLKFSEYYGRNLDAFNDCMADVEVPMEGGTAIVIRNVDSVELRDGQFISVILDILAGTTRKNLLFGRRMLTLLQSENPRIAFPVVAPVTVMWNPKEWLNSERGL